MGVRIAANLIVESKVLAARQKRALNDIVEEALQDLLKKYREKKVLVVGHDSQISEQTPEKEPEGLFTCSCLVCSANEGDSPAQTGWMAAHQ